MNLDQVDQAANWFEAFLRHTSVISIVLSLVGSWCATLVVRFPIRMLIAPRWQAWLIRTLDVMIAFLICLLTWPNSWGLAWAITVGCASPVIYSFLCFLLIAKWPSLRPLLTLRELESDTVIDLPPPQ
jgi:hypothetical protein